MKSLRLLFTVGALLIILGSLKGDSFHSYLTKYFSNFKSDASSLPSGIEPKASYKIEAVLIPESRKLEATERMTWVNASSKAVDTLQFHLYYNAFKNPNSTFMMEGKEYKKSRRELDKLKYGEIKIKELTLLPGSDLMNNIRYLTPDDNNEADHTVMAVKLPKMVQPGEWVNVKFQYTLTIPQIFHRTGMEDDYFFIAQWFPKIGVLQADGQWNCHQFHRNSEFFSDYGDYDIFLTLPRKFIIGATGNLMKYETNADGTVSYQFHEKNIHDFAWTAYPDFERSTREIVLDKSKKKVIVELLLSPGNLFAKDRYLNALKHTLNFMDRTIFPYPYRKITLVDPPLKGFQSGSMEYPTLIVLNYHPFMSNAFKYPELVVFHEMVHQYFYGLIGTDEFREAWLDEGVTSFFEHEIADDYFKQSTLFGISGIISVNDWEWARLNNNLLVPINPINEYSWNFPDSFQYAGNVYYKTAILLRSLKHVVGRDRMYNFFRFYAEKYKFKHPTTEDFIDTFNTFMNDDFSWAFDQFVKKEGRLDNAVYSVDSFKLSNDDDKSDRYRNEVIFIRNEGYFPVQLWINLENGKTVKHYWKEKERWRKIVFEDTSPIKDAVVDPFYHIPMDRNYLNNSKVRNTNKSGLKRLAMRFGFLFQNLLANGMW